MKKIEAIIRPEKVDEVRRALEKVGFPGLHIGEVEGHGKQKGVVQQWRGEQYRVELLSKVKLEIVANDKDASKIVQAIQDAAKTGGVGDGKIFISPVEEVIRIRTGERGDSAL
ncbi:MAG: P-II family nitrogen regulator [Candidatus Omnitrophica bacterium]|nr:P-II family nitrogen regulator [Candidatus Omnitrophota bacterium]